MNRDEDVTAIRLRMQHIRSCLSEESVQIRKQARRMTDWHYYVGMFPWTSIAAAAAVGYLVIPKRPQVVQAGADALVKLAKQDRVIVQSLSDQPPSKGLLGTLTSIGSAMLLRAGKSYLTQRAQQMMNQPRG